MSKTVAIIITQTAEGTFQVLDAAGRMHEVSDVLELGKLCQTLLDDPTLPTYENLPEQTVQLEEVATKVTAKMFPDFEFAAAPAVALLRSTVSTLHQNVRGKPKTKKPKMKVPKATFAQVALRARNQQNRAGSPKNG